MDLSPLFGVGFFLPNPALISTKRIFGMRKRNLLYAGKLAIVLPVSSTLPKDGLPALSERVFFPAFYSPKEKTRNRHRCGFPCLLASQFLGMDFRAHHDGKYVACLQAAQHFMLEIKKPAGEITAGLNPVQGNGGDKHILPWTEPLKKSEECLILRRNLLSLIQWFLCSDFTLPAS